MKSRFSSLIVFCFTILSFSVFYVKAGNLSINDQVITAFQNYIQTFNVQFTNTQDQSNALLNFQTNFQNAASFVGSFSLTTQNKFSLISPEEFARMYLTLRVDTSSLIPPAFSLSADANSTTPKTLDLRTLNQVTAVRDQSTCGCCWAFSTAASLEGVYAKKFGTLLSFSDQHILSCTPGNNSCNGGIMHEAYKWVQSNGGVSLLSNLKYDNSKTTCLANTNKFSLGLDTQNYYLNLSSSSIDQLKNILNTKGPISVGINADKLQLYKTGIYSCAPNVSINHAVTIIGYGSSDNTDYWIVKNSWGQNWGQNGYFYLAQDTTKNCGLNNYAVQPILQ